MAWLWQQKDWPTFTFDEGKYGVQEDVFFANSGRVSGSIEHLEVEQGEVFKINILCQEAVATSAIEGELLDRDSVQSSIRRHMGLQTDRRRPSAAEAGVAEMHVDVYAKYAEPLTHEMMHEWHAMLMNGRRDLQDIGTYRTHAEPMQIVSGSYSKPKVYYEAPPSAMVYSEMERYVEWFNAAVADRQRSVLGTAAVAHLYFEMIHPYEDGNGRIGRALVEKVLSTRLGGPSLLLLRLYDVAQEGFEGGVSAKKYVSITKASPSSATRDLQQLAELGVLYKTGQLKGTRYHLAGPDGLRL